MARVLILFCLLLASPVSAKKTNPKKQAIEKLLTTIQVNDFVSNVQKIKKYNSVSDIKELDYKLKQFFRNIKLWYFFDEQNFKKGLVEKFEKGLSLAEIREVNSIFKKPFFLKVLNASVLHRDLFAYNENSVDENYELPEVAESRYTLMVNMYNLYGMDIQKEELVNRLKPIVGSGKVMVKVLSKKRKNTVFIDPVRLEKRMKDPKDFIVKYLASDLKDFRHYEIREYFRKFKHSQSAQKFLQLYANYHFLYLTKYINKIEQDKLNELKALKITK